MKIRPSIVIFSLILLVLTAPFRSMASDVADLTAMSLEELLEVEISSISRKPQKVSEVPAAVFVITADDINRSGVRTIADALRMVPGLDVAQINGNIWAVSSRGFNGRLANKLLVLMDGRSLYTPFYSGVFWDVQDTLLDNIDRIEIIRGPGASLWGANAVNGIINIVTKEAAKTQGVYAETGAGDYERGFGGLRFGGKWGSDTAYRVYTKLFQRDGFLDIPPENGVDGQTDLQGGFRVDWLNKKQDSLTVQGDAYTGRSGIVNTLPSLTSPPTFSETSIGDASTYGHNLLSRWTHAFSNGSESSLQLYYDREQRDLGLIEFGVDTLDADFQHRFSVGSRQQWMWGLGYRAILFDTTDGRTSQFIPDDWTDQVFSGFLQDEIALVPDKLFLTLGTKLEHNDLSGFEAQPSGQLLWNVDAQNVLWGSISRAVRTPSRGETNIVSENRVLPPQPGILPAPTLVVLRGNEDFGSEEVVAYEMGYRSRVADWLGLDVAAYYNRYDDLRTIEPISLVSTTDPVPHLVLTSTAENKMDGQGYGIEVSADMKLRDWWHVYPAYTYTRLFLHLDPDSRDMTSEAGEGEAPEHQFSLRSSFNLPYRVELDGWLRYVDSLPSQGISSYVTMDARLSWHASDNLELTLVGRNLLDKSHAEFIPEILGSVPVEIERSVYGKVTWRF